MKRTLLLSVVALMACPSTNAEDDGGAGGGTGATGGGSGSMKSAKRGIAYDLASPADLSALRDGVSWSYNWSPTPHVSADAGIAFVPMLWSFNFNADDVIAYLRAHRDVHAVMVLNEPNLTDQSNQTPQQAADNWPKYEALAQDAGVLLVGPQLTWGTMPGYADPVVWIDAFYDAYRGAHDGGDPRVDVIGFHWYDYGLTGQLDRLTKYGKPFWVTEMSNWHVGDGTAAIDTAEKQATQLTEMVAACEARSDVERYAWFTGRWDNDVHFTSLLSDAGVLTPLGETYVNAPY